MTLVPFALPGVLSLCSIGSKRILAATLDFARVTLLDVDKDSASLGATTDGSIASLLLDLVALFLGAPASSESFAAVLNVGLDVAVPATSGSSLASATSASTFLELDLLVRLSEGEFLSRLVSGETPVTLDIALVNFRQMSDDR